MATQGLTSDSKILGNFDFYSFQFAAAKAGLILVNINPSYKSSELSYVLKMCGIKGVISDTSYGLQNYEQIWQKTLGESKNLDLEFVAFRGSDFEPLDGVRTFSFENFRDSADSYFQNKREEIISKAQCDDNVNIQFTSGTTGFPKGQCLKAGPTSFEISSGPGRHCLKISPDWMRIYKNLKLLNLMQHGPFSCISW